MGISEDEIIAEGATILVEHSVRLRFPALVVYPRVVMAAVEAAPEFGTAERADVFPPDHFVEDNLFFTLMTNLHANVNLHRQNTLSGRGSGGAKRHSTWIRSSMIRAKFVNSWRCISLQENSGNPRAILAAWVAQ